MKYSSILTTIAIIALSFSMVANVPLAKQPMAASYNSPFQAKSGNISLCTVNSTACKFKFTSTNGSLPVNVMAGDYFNASYLKANLTACHFYAYKLAFSWNFDMGYSTTNIQILFTEGSQTLLSMTFGMKSENVLLINSGKTSETISEGIKQNTRYNLTIGFSPNTRDAYISIGPAASGYLKVPIMFNDSAAYNLNGSNSIDFGGNYYNLTLYSIHGVSGLFPVTQRNERVISPEKNYLFPANSGISGNIEPYYDGGLNTAIFPMNNSLISFLNLVNGSFWHESLPAVFGKFSGWVKSKNMLYMLFGNKSSSGILSLNLSNLNIRYYSQIIPYGNSMLSYVNRNLLVFGSNGTLLVYRNDSAGYFTEKIKISHGTIAYVHPGENTTYFAVINLSTDIITSCSIDSGLSVKELSQVKILNYSKISIVSVQGQNGYLSSLIAGQNEGPDGLWLNSNLLLNVNSTFEHAGNRTIYSTSNSLFIMNSSVTTQIYSGINEIKSFSYFEPTNIFLVLNRTEIAIGNISNGNLSGGLKPIISVPANVIINGTYNFSFSEDSQMQFRAALQILNRTFTSINDSYFELNTSQFPNGIYPYTLAVYSLNGYSDNFSGSLTIDNAIPLVNISAGNVSTIYPGEYISVSVKDIVGVKSISYRFANQAFQVNNASFLIRVPRLGNISSVFLNYTVFDDLGRSFSFTVPYKYIAENHSRFSSSMGNGTYISTGNFNLSFTPLANVSYFLINISRDGSTVFSEITGEPWAMVNNIGNGLFELNISACYSTGNIVNLQKSNFTVISYAPGISYKETNETFYSFHGNSLNNSMNLQLSSNVSSNIYMRICNGTGFQVMGIIYHDRLNFTLNRSNSEFFHNGIYYIYVTATSFSGTVAEFNTSFTVNNTLPVLTLSDTYFVNKSAIPVNISRSLRVSLSSSSNGLFFSNDTIEMNETGTYRFTITVTSESLNTATSSSTIYYYVAKPVILFHGNVSSYDMHSKSIDINISVKDRISISRLFYTLGNKSFVIKNNSMIITPAQDGTYNLLVYAYDACGNWNHSSAINVTDEYFPKVFSSKINGIVIGKYPYLAVSMKGYALSKVNVTWFVNNNKEGNGTSFNKALPLGVDIITVQLKFGNHTVLDSYRAISITNTPILVPVIIIGIFFMVTVARRDRSRDRISDFLRSMDHCSIKDLKKRCRKQNFSFRQAKKVIPKMISSGELAYGKDLDGRKFIIKK